MVFLPTKTWTWGIRAAWILFSSLWYLGDFWFGAGAGDHYFKFGAGGDCLVCFSPSMFKNIRSGMCRMELCLTYILYTQIAVYLADILCMPRVCVWVLCLNVCGLHSCTHRCPALYEALKRSDFPNLLPNCKNKAVKNDGCETSFTIVSHVYEL